MTADPTITDESQEMAAEADLGAAIGAFAERIAMAAISSFELATVELGSRLGLYEALAEGPVTPPELAGRAGIDTRYAREWLEQQATGGFVAVDADPADGDPDHRVFSLPVAHQACLLDPDSLAYVAPLATFATAGPGVAARARRRLPGRHRHPLRGVRRVDPPGPGGGQPAPVHQPAGDRVAADHARRGGQARSGDGPGRRHRLWLRLVVDRPGPRASTASWSTGSTATRPRSPTPSATRPTPASADRTRFAADAATGDGRYDLVCCFEALHDMAHPVEALASMRRMAGPDGAVFIGDERAADALTPNDPDPMQRLFYSASVLHCLPVGRSEQRSAATGTVLRTATLERYAD